MRKSRIALATAAIAGLVMTAVSACANVGTLNAISRNDPGAKRVAQDVAYGDLARQSLDVFVPDDATANSPVMMFIYGGSWENGAKKDYSFVGHAFASRGFVTVLIDYRLVPDVTYPAFIEDAAAGFKWTHDNIAQYKGDPSRIYVSGHSAGAYNAVMLGMAPEFLGAHGLAPSDIAGVAGISGPYDFLPLDWPSTIAAFGQAEDKLATQPINRVSGELPPFYLVTGTADKTVNQRNTKALEAALKDGGYSVETKFYPELSHADTIMAFSTTFRGKGPLLDDVSAFAGRAPLAE